MHILFFGNFYFGIFHENYKWLLQSEQEVLGAASCMQLISPGAIWSEITCISLVVAGWSEACETETLVRQADWWQ